MDLARSKNGKMYIKLLRDGTRRYPSSKIIEEFPDLEYVYNNRRLRSQRRKCPVRGKWHDKGWQGEVKFLNDLKKFFNGIDLTSELIPTGVLLDLAETMNVTRRAAHMRIRRLWRKGEIRRFKEKGEVCGVWYVLDKVPFHPYKASISYKEIDRGEVIKKLWNLTKHTRNC